MGHAPVSPMSSTALSNRRHGVTQPETGQAMPPADHAELLVDGLGLSGGHHDRSPREPPGPPSPDRHTAADDNDDHELDDRDGATTPPPLPSPALSSPVSLYRLALSPFTRHLSFSATPETTASPNGEEREDGNSSASSSEDSQNDLTQDNKDVLVQRLSDLISRVGSARDFDSVSALHAKVDEMEGVLEAGGPGGGASAAKRRRIRQTRPRPLSLDSSTGAMTGTLAGGIFSARGGNPAHALLRGRFSDLSQVLAESPVPRSQGEKELQGGSSEPEPPRKKAAVSAEDARRIADEARELNEHLTSLVTKLQSRQEESEHLHALLIERAEKAAQRILSLEAEVQDLRSSLHEDNAELTSLRVSLKAIELKLPPTAEIDDDDLRRSIQNWKADWKRLKASRAAKLGREASFVSSAPSTPG